MHRSITAMGKLVAVSAAVIAPVLLAGCEPCPTATCAPAAPACPAPAVAYAVSPAVPVCDDSVAFDGSVIQNGQLVYDGAVVNRALAGMPQHPGYAPAVYAASKPAKAAAKESARVDAKPRKAGGESAKVAKAKAPAAKPVPAPAKAAPEAPKVVVLPPTTTAPYVITEDKTYAIIQGDAAVVHAPVPNVSEAYVDPAEAARVAAPTGIRVLGPSTLNISDAEIDHYSKSESFGIPPEPAPVPE